MSRTSMSERALRRMRARIWDYDDTPNEKKADQVLLYLKKRVMRQRRNDRLANPPSVGPYSGLTQAELRATGTCETDWY